MKARDKLFLLLIILVSCCASAIAQSAVQSEAQAQADSFWNRKVGHCGADMYYASDNGGFTQLRSGKWVVKAEQLRQVDQLNGLQWRGTTTLVAALSRSYPNRGGWGPWEEGLGYPAFYTVEMEKRNGQWKLVPDAPFGGLNGLFAPACDRIPKEVTVTPQQLEESKRQSQSSACQLALHPGDALSTLDNLLRSGADPNMCLDANGRNLLMLLPMEDRYAWDGQSITLIQSGQINLNAKDRFGAPALLYVLIRYKLSQESRPSYLPSYQQVLQTMLNRGADPAGFYAADRTTVLWDRVPLNFPGTSPPPPPPAKTIAVPRVALTTAAGTQVYAIGGGVSPPVPTYQPEPEYTELARRNKLEGVVRVQVVVNVNGVPEDFKVIRSLGMGLDEKAVEALRKWRFRPAVLNGKPVAALGIIELNFHFL